MLQLAQQAATAANLMDYENVEDQVSALHAAAQSALPDIYAVLDATPSDDASSVQTELLTESDLTSTFTQDGAADAVRGLVYGEAAAVQYSSYALMMLVRLDPLDADTLDSLRAQALSDMKSGELQDSIQSYGAQLPHALDSAAMKKMPASKIKNEQ